MAQASKAFQQRISAKEGQHRHGECDGPWVVVPHPEPACGGDEDDGADTGRPVEERTRQRPGRDSAAGGPGIQRVQWRVQQPVHRHRDRTGAHHAHDNEQQLSSFRPAGRRQECAEQCERQGEYGVADLDVGGEQGESGRWRGHSGIPSISCDRLTLAAPLGVSRPGRFPAG